MFLCGGSVVFCWCLFFVGEWTASFVPKAVRLFEKEVRGSTFKRTSFTQFLLPGLTNYNFKRNDTKTWGPVLALTGESKTSKHCDVRLQFSQLYNSVAHVFKKATIFTSENFNELTADIGRLFRLVMFRILSVTKGV